MPITTMSRITTKTTAPTINPFGDPLDGSWAMDPGGDEVGENASVRYDPVFEVDDGSVGGSARDPPHHWQ